MRQLFSFVLALFMSSGCGHGSSGTAPDSVANLVTNGSFAARIDGTGWTAAGAVTVVKPGADNLNITAVSTTYGVAFKLAGVTAPGVFPLTAIPTTGSTAAVTHTNGMRWVTGGLGLTGSITITTFTASRVAGSFSFQAAPVSGGAIGVVQVTNGAFDVIY
jgi:hypothetical protein